MNPNVTAKAKNDKITRDACGALAGFSKKLKDCKDKDNLKPKAISELEADEGAFNTNAKKLIIASVSLYTSFVTTAFSMIAPFFPGVAAKKGANPVIVGLIFTAYPMAIIIFSPIVAMVIPFIGLKRALVFGLILEGGSQIIFGFLPMIPNSTTFVVCSFIIRISAGIGAAATQTSSLTLISQTFQSKAATAMGMIQTFSGLGFTVGPPLGGFLYSVGGFHLPFMIIGTIIIVSTIPIHFIIPNLETTEKKETRGIQPILDVLKTSSIFIIAVAICNGGIAFAAIEPLLTRHLKKPYHLSSAQVGLTFLILAGSYAVTAPISGRVANRVDKRVMIVVGAFIAGFGYIILGPAPFLPSQIFPRTLWLDCVALALAGIGHAVYFIPTLPDMNDSSRIYGMEEGIVTQSAVSSIFNSFLYLGAVIGPTLGGILVNNVKFPWTSTIIGFLFVALGIAIAIFTVSERKSAPYTLLRKMEEED